MAQIDGIYACYMSGSEGNGFAMFIFSNGVVSGADPLGVLFDGSYTEDDDGTVNALVSVTVPQGGTVIQGVSAGPSGLIYRVPLKLLPNFEDQDFLQIETPLGPVNVRLKKIRGLE